MFLRRLLLFVLLASMSATAPARAIAVSPSGSYTLTSTGSFEFRLASNGQRPTCTSSRFDVTVSRSGASSSPSGSAVFGGCSDPLLGVRTTTQTSAWTATVALTAGSPLALAVAFTIPTGGLTVSYTGGCVYTMSGSFTIGRSYAALPVAVAVTDSFPITTSSLVVDSVASGCSPLLVLAGLRLTISATYQLNRAMTVSG